MIVFPSPTSPTPLIASCGTVRTLGLAEHHSYLRAVTGVLRVFRASTQSQDSTVFVACDQARVRLFVDLDPVVLAL